MTLSSKIRRVQPTAMHFNIRDPLTHITSIYLTEVELATYHKISVANLGSQLYYHKLKGSW